MNENEKKIMVHEKQWLQQCGIHAINNLLQLSKSDAVNETGKTNQKRVTIEEMNQISDELTHRELKILSNDYDKNNDEVYHRLSLLDKWKSHHRTPIFGNYSYEALEMALHRRNARLIRYTQKQDRKIVLGYLLNIKTETLSLLQYIPFLRNSRHWYCISKVVIKHDSESKKMNGTQLMESENVSWNVIDSKASQITVLRSITELDEYLFDIQNSKGEVFTVLPKNE